MKKGQSNHICECTSLGLNDSENEINLNITIIGISESNSNPNTFVLIIRDDTILKEQQHEAQIAKSISEKLLYQILPRDIVNKINIGEKDICFSVSQSSIVFIDIVKFSDYSSNSSPSKIMETLTLIFSTFDRLSSKYPLITKIKLIGDIYMAGSGLFSNDSSSTLHAEQLVRFCLDVLSAMDDINTQLCTSLLLRIGINSGGPIICGVFGTDKPVFDIIGDPINIASRLQSTAIPGTIHISESTYECIKHLNIDVERRGETQLKGKGKMNTYLVRPAYASEMLFNELTSMSDTNIGHSSRK